MKNGKVAAYHILSQSRIHTIIIFEDLYCSEHRTYNNVEVLHNLDDTQIASATFQLPLWDDESKCYKFENNISQCTRFRITKFNPIMI